MILQGDQVSDSHRTLTDGAVRLGRVIAATCSNSLQARNEAHWASDVHFEGILTIFDRLVIVSFQGIRIYAYPPAVLHNLGNGGTDKVW